MKLITREIEKLAPALYATEGTPVAEKFVVAKFFHPAGRGTWYMIEYDPERKLAFGFVVSPLGPDLDELGYFSIDELENVRDPFGLTIERDIHFSPTHMKNIKLWRNR